jgi:hypothetical protein
MGDELEPRNEAPLEPAYALGQPGDTILVYAGDVEGVYPRTREGRIELSLGPTPSLAWSIEREPDDCMRELHDLTLVIERRGQRWAVEASPKGRESGWINNCVLGSAHAKLSRVLVNWVNVPSILGHVALTAEVENRTFHWAGRWRAVVDGWSLVIDERPDHARVFRQARLAHSSVMTHVMEIKRDAGHLFSVEEVEKLIEALRMSLSFAVGSWVAPVLPVGYSDTGQVVWETWSSAICDVPRGSSYAWLPGERRDDLVEFLARSVSAIERSNPPGLVRFQMVFAVETAGGNFNEQRIMAGFSALENLEWTLLVLKGQVAEEAFRGRGWPGDKRLRVALRTAHIPTSIDASSLPALAALAATKGLDGPGAVVHVRNHLVHPTRLQEDIYKNRGLTRDAWLLVRHYVNLLILFSVGYSGSFARLLPPWGWAGEVEPVPWTVGPPDAGRRRNPERRGKGATSSG